MEPTKKRRGSLLRNVFGTSSSTTGSQPSGVSSGDKMRAEIGLKNTTLRMIPTPNELKPTFTLFQTRMLKKIDRKDVGIESGLGLRYVPVETPKPPIPMIRITKADGIPFTLKEEEVPPEIEPDATFRSMRAERGIELSDTPVPISSTSEENETFMREDGRVFGRSRAGSLSRTKTIQSRRDSISRRNEILPKLAEVQVGHRYSPSRVRSPSSPPPTPPLPDDEANTFTSSTVYTRKLRKIPPGSIVGGEVHPYFRSYDKELPSPPSSPDGYDKELPSLPSSPTGGMDEVSSVSSLDSSSSMSSFSSAIRSHPLSDKDNIHSIIATRDSASTNRDSWLTYWSDMDDEEVEKQGREAELPESTRLREMTKELREKRGGGAGTFKWGGMGIDGVVLRIPRKPVGLY